MAIPNTLNNTTLTLPLDGIALAYIYTVTKLVTSLKLPIFGVSQKLE